MCVPLASRGGVSDRYVTAIPQHSSTVGATYIHSLNGLPSLRRSECVICLSRCCAHLGSTCAGRLSSGDPLQPGRASAAEGDSVGAGYLCHPPPIQIGVPTENQSQRTLRLSTLLCPHTPRLALLAHHHLLLPPPSVLPTHVLRAYREGPSRSASAADCCSIGNSAA